MPMQIEVHLFATLRQGRFRQKTLQVPPGCTVADVCRQLVIGDGEAAMLMVNGAAAQADHQLAPGDEVALFPALGGG
jgi:sulfur carrier protein ThiS